jgi:hypothetical protein
LIILHDPKDVRDDWAHIETMMTYLRPTVHEMSAASGAWMRNRYFSIADASPFLVFWPYHIITILHRLRWEYSEESERIMALMQGKLSIMSKRWLLGGTESHFLQKIRADISVEAYAQIHRATVAAEMSR